MGHVRVRDALARVRVFAVALVIAAGAMALAPATTHANTLVGCNTGGLIAAVNAAVTAGSGTLDLTPGCTYKLTSADPSGYGLPSITGSVTIHGNGATIKRVAGAPQFGLMNVFGTLVIDHVTLTGGNTTNYGGALRAIGSSSVTLTDSTVSGNTAVLGGGVFFNNGVYFVIRSTITDNTATNGGGGIWNNGGTETIANSTITANGAPVGGGVYNFVNALTLTNSTVSGNSAGAGIYNDFALGGTMTAANTILSGNTGGDCAIPQGPFTSGGYNLAGDATCALGAATDVSSVDPLLGTLQGNGGPTETEAPGSTSPALDAIPVGANGCGTTVNPDQRGVARPQGAGCDIGAYETGDVAMLSLKPTPKIVKSGTNVTYVATVVSAGAVDATGVVVADKLPTGLSFVSAQASQGSCSFVAPKVTCSLGQFPAATTATVTIVATVTATPLSAITNKATVSATTGDAVASNDTKTAKIKVK